MGSEIKIDRPAAVDRSMPAGGGKKESVKKTAENFESFMILTMLKELDKATHITKKSYAEETQKSIFYEKVAEFMAKKGIGIKETIMKYLERGGAKVSGKNGENSQIGGVA
jgi:Rod binding domain-containing protein